jgi:hypothetical protein
MTLQESVLVSHIANIFDSRRRMEPDSHVYKLHALMVEGKSFATDQEIV